MITLVLASANDHKMQEISRMLPEGFRLKTIRDVGFSDPVPETATTIRGNSEIKARALQDFLLLKNDQSWVIADDSGLEVNALNGAPGVYSARYAGDGATDGENVKKLLREMQDKTDRKARFVTVITLLTGGSAHFFEGEIKGTIAWEPRGGNGFGYDPVFIPTGYRSTFGELSPEEKNTISHRAKAVAGLIGFLGR